MPCSYSAVYVGLQWSQQVIVNPIFSFEGFLLPLNCTGNIHNYQVKNRATSLC